MAGEPERDTSDLFKLPSQQSPESIAPVSEVLLPPEEIRRRRMRRVVAITIAVILTALTAYTVYYFVHAAGVDDAAHAAGDSGRLADIDAALEALGDGEKPGLRARLMAMAALAGARDPREARAAFEAVDADDEHEASERFKAQVYLELVEGDLTEAYESASALIPAGTFAAETAHARSLAFYAAGHASNAVSESQSATGVRDAPRYASQLALAQLRANGAEAALGTIEAHADSGATAMQLVRARALAEARLEGAREAAQAVLEASDALPAETAWAHLALADLALAAGDRGAVAEALEAAFESPPPGDRAFVWRGAEIAATVGLADWAAEHVEEVPQGPLPEAAVSKRALAAIAVARGDGARALELLGEVPASPRAFLLVGRAHDLNEQWDAARRAYDGAAEARGWSAEAQARRAETELGAGQAEAALGFAEQALESAPTHPVVARAGARALLGNERAEDALAAAERGLAEHPEDGLLLAVKADAELALERFGDALVTLRAAAVQIEGDPELQAKLGQAAHHEGEGEEARGAYEAALAIAEEHPEALVGLFTLDLEEHRIDHAEEVLGRIDDAELSSPEILVLETRYLVAKGAGTQGTRTVLRAMRRRGLRRSAYLRRALAMLQLQAEMYRPAVGMFGQALRMGEEVFHDRVGVAYASALDGRTNQANEAINEAASDAEAAGIEREQDPWYLVARGRIEFNVGRFDNAGDYADQALALDARMTEAHLLKAEVILRRRRDPNEELRAALEFPRPQTRAAALLARRLGPTEEGCALARQYIRRTVRSSEFADVMERIADQCGEE